MVDRSHIVSRAPIKANWFENQRWYEAMTVWGNGTSITGCLNQTCQCLESQQIICRMISGLLWITIVLWSGLLYQLFSSGDVNWWISIWVTKWFVFHGNPYIISYMFLLGLGHRESKKNSYRGHWRLVLSLLVVVDQSLAYSDATQICIVK